MNENGKIGYYAIIPATVLFNKELKQMKNYYMQ